MRRHRSVALAVCMTLVASASGAEINRSPIPILRPSVQGAGLDVADRVARIVETSLAQGLTVSKIPLQRPVRRETSVVTKARTQAYGAVCGKKDIRGTQLSAIPARLNGCGLAQPVKVSEISGVKLSSPATIDCTTAKALRTWVKRGAKPAVGRRGGGLVELKVVASYACRTRNNLPGAKISEHGRGRAVDIAGVTLKNGEYISVLEGWKKRRHKKILRKMHKAACGPFGTVLGPDADKYHIDHFHFDTARYGSKSYCR